MATRDGGQNELIMKSDGEPAIVAVREALARCHGERVTPEQPPKGEHQANDLAEVTGRNVRDHVRVLKLQLQKRLERQVLEDEPRCEIHHAYTTYNYDYVLIWWWDT